MTEKDLRDLLPFLCNHRVAGQGRVRVDALSRMYISYNDYICVSSFDDCAVRGKVARKADALYHALCLSGPDAADGNGLSGIKWLARMYRLTKDMSMAVYGKKDEDCSRKYHELMPGYMSSPDDEIAAMQCVVYELGNALGDIGAMDYYAWFRERCSSWISDAGAAGCWDNIDEMTALQRLALLQDNSRVFGDAGFDREACSIYKVYRSRLSMPMCLSNDSLPFYGAWYDLLKKSDLYPYEPLLQKQIAVLMENFALAAGYRTDGWYTSTAFAVEQCCAEAMSAMQKFN